MPVVQFAPFSSLAEPAFWHALTELKVNVLRLDDNAIPITASYVSGRSTTDRETGAEIALGCNLMVGGDAFSEAAQPAAHAVIARGIFKNFNTIEDFKAADKTALFNHVTDKVCRNLYIMKAYR